MAKKIEKYLPVDYSDSFSIEVTENRLSPKDIILKVFAHNPAWLRMLYAISVLLMDINYLIIQNINAYWSCFFKGKALFL